jgi:hypothetical protein
MLVTQKSGTVSITNWSEWRVPHVSILRRGVQYFGLAGR